MRTRINGPRRCNCLVWAVNRWLRKGGYLAIRQSRPAPWKPHFVWSAECSFWWGYVPIRPRRGFAAIFDSLFFAGRVELEHG